MRARINVWVTAVVVLWSPFPARVVEGNQIVFVHGDELARWLRARSRRHNETMIEALARHLTTGYVQDEHRA